ncbi:MAG: hypothetical protein GDA40_08655 [Rhodobacteraceae bacterium]|nr:hypothetical protein [Paracoccaceae bacterium]
MAVVLVVSVILLDLISGAPILSSVFSDVLDEVEKAEEDIPWVYAAAIIAPITSLTTICIFLLIAAFRGFKNKDIDDLAGPHKVKGARWATTPPADETAVVGPHASGPYPAQGEAI